MNSVMISARGLAKNVMPLSTVLSRSMGVSAPALKASDPVQQMFLDKLKEYKSKSSGGKLVEATAQIEREWKQELTKLASQYGGGEGQDMTKFPDFKFTEPKLDPINL